MSWKSPLVALLWMTLASASASAQQLDLELNDSRPYARGVPQEKQERARALFLAGHAFFQKSDHPAALEKFREALESWDHPSIHYMIVLVLQYTDNYLELHRHATAALRYRDHGPLVPAMIQNAENLIAKAERNLVRLKISCDVPGAAVTMDGQLLFQGPGRYEEWGTPGTHVFRFTKGGYPPNERTRTTHGGETIALHIQKLYTQEDLIRSTRPWPAWKPMVVLGMGAGLLAGGGVLHLRARDSYQDFDGRVIDCGRGGCEPGSGLLELRHRGDTFQRVAVGSYAVGSAVLVTGAVLAFINRAHSYPITPDQYEEGMGSTLTLGADTSGAWATLRF